MKNTTNPYTAYKFNIIDVLTKNIVEQVIIIAKNLGAAKSKVNMQVGEGYVAEYDIATIHQ